VQSVAVDRTKHTIFGLSNGDGGQDYTDIDFAIHLQGEAGWPGDLVIFEGGAEKHRINSTQQNPAYVAGDVLKVAVTNGVVRYYKNEVLLYTSQSTPVFPLLLDASVFHLNAKVQDAWLCSSGGGSDSRPGGSGVIGTVPAQQGTPTATTTPTATMASAKSTITSNPTSIYRGGTPSTPAKSGTPSIPQKPQRPNSPNVVNTIIYLHADHLGSVSAATNASGTPVSSQEYDPWGKVRSGGVTQTKRNYTGQKLDDTGLLYYHARMYDPQLGRFVSPDSTVPGASSLDLGFSKGDAKIAPANPQALSRYTYTFNNPVKYTDPSGHDPKTPGYYEMLSLTYRHLMTTIGAPGYGKGDSDFLALRGEMNKTAIGLAVGTVSPIIGVASLGARHGAWAKYLIPHVMDNGKWDMKGYLTQQFTGNPYVEGNDLYFHMPGTPNDMHTNFNVFGNVYFGYLAAAAGLSDEEAVAGAAAADEASRSYNTIDQNAVHLGIRLWRKYGPNMTLQQFDEAIRANSAVGLPKGTQIAHTCKAGKPCSD